MGKWRFSKQLSSPGLSLLAFLAAVAVHALFLVPGYRTADTGLDRPNTGVSVLNMASLPSRERHSLQNWIRTHDPARAARSGSASGYMAQLPAKKTRSVPVEPFAGEVIRTQLSLRPFAPLPESSVLPLLPPLPDEQRPAAAVSVPPTVFDGSGRRLKAIPPLPPNAGSGKPTVISLRKTGKVFVSSLLKSSGNPLLDRIARREALKWHSPESTTLIFVWPEVKK